MLPNDRAQPAAPDKPTLGARMMHAYRRLPLWLKVLTVIAAVFLSGPIILVAMVYGVVAVAQGRRTVGASISVALWGAVVFSFAYKGHGTWLYSVILLPFLVALAAHAKPLARWFVPCRTSGRPGCPSPLASRARPRPAATRPPCRGTAGSVPS